ncbi:MAG TPA: tetratricopeptide repeat protein [Gemmatimonadaceae bacterium]|nr:tetratricopeptide repeat protein [Gemmatimonadaceae bacterium]
MSKVAQLKKQAAEFEQKKQIDKALALYVKLLDSFDEYADELDVALFNRVGDLMLRQGNVADAVDYYEKAVDRYADTGFFNNAIALCNKILRQSPGRASVYYKLGKISAQKGFKGEAKVNFLEYADRMQKAGKTDEAFRALKEFADLSPDQEEIRLMLADQLTKAERKDEAIDQLQILHARYQSEGRGDDAASTADRIRALDPTVEIKSDGGSRRATKSQDLIFLDLDDAPRARTSGAIPVQSEPAPPPRAPTPARSAPPVAPMTPPAPITPVAAQPSLDEPSLVDEPMEAPITRADIAIQGTPAHPMDAPLSGITRIGDEERANALAIDKTPSESLLGLEQTYLADADLIRSTPTSSLLDFEPTSLGAEEPPPLHRSSAPTHASRDEAPIERIDETGEESIGGELQFIVPDVDDEPTRETPSIEFDVSALTTPATSLPPAPPLPTPAHAALDGLPLMDVDVPTVPTPPAASTPRATTSLEEITLSDDLGLIDDEADESAAEPLEELVDLNTESLTIDDEPMPTPSVARRSTMVAMHSVEILHASVEGEPENWSLRRELAEAMLEAGDRDGGIKELETAMSGAERGGDLELAMSLAEELARLEPAAVRHHQKRVEYAFRKNDRPRLIEAYLSLGGSLVDAEQGDKARTVYQRVLDLAPDELRARAALDALQGPEPEPEPQPRAAGPGARRPSVGVQAPQEPAPAASNSFVNLGDWLRDDEQPKDTRMVVAEQEPTGDEDADFQDMLRKFKQGVAENVDAEDYQSHYDLAIAFKEMGLLDEAIAEFQKALGSPTNRLPTYEALGQCFLEKGQPRLASSILSRGLNEKASEDQLVGVLYLLGRAAEEQGNAAEALTYYQRVFVLDIQFRDIAERMNEVERAAR